MVRRFAFVAAVLTVAVPAAQAKAPPNGTVFCGAADACVSLTWQQAEELRLWTPIGERAPSAPAPYYALHVRWTADSAEELFYWIPSRGVVRRVYDWGGVGWFRVGAQPLTPPVAGIAPIAVPQVTAATVGGRRVKSPATYLRLFSAGRAVDVSPVSEWLRVRFVASERSPWTDPETDLRISKTGGYLWRDRFVFRIPVHLADRARRGLPLAE